MPFRDLFDGTSLGAQWTPAHSGTGAHSVSGGSVTLSVSDGTSRARIPVTTSESWGVGFRYEVQLTAEPPSSTTTGLAIRLSGAAFHPFIWWDGFNQRVAVGWVDGSNDWNAYTVVSVAFAPYLGLTRNGDNSITYSYSSDGSAWTDVTTRAAGIDWSATAVQGLVAPELFFWRNAAGSASFTAFNPNYSAGGVIPPAVLRRRLSTLY